MSNFQFQVWPTEAKFITQHFGVRPLVYAEFGLPGHEGLDFQAPKGGRIFCVAPGKVRAINHDDGTRPYGNDVRVEHADGFETIYAHLSAIKVEIGQTLNVGDLVGLAGDTGNVEGGAHLHLTLKNFNGGQLGYPNHIVDPTPYFMHLLDPAWDDARFVRDTVPDGTVMEPNQSFVQTWFLENTGATTWGIGYQLRHLGGDRMGAPASINLPPAPPRAQIPISVPFHAPTTPGIHRATFRLCDPENNFFGDPIWVEVAVRDHQVAQPAAIAHHFVQARGTQFLLDGQPYRFFGLNLRGLCHYGRRSADPLRFSHLGHRESQLREAQKVGASVVRLFLPDKDATVGEIEQRLRELVDIIKANFPDMYLIPVFTNLYADVPFHVPGDNGFFAQTHHGNTLLSKEFFAQGYRQNYLPFVQRIVAAFRNEPNIFAWEIGNELKLDRGNLNDPNDPNPNLFVKFNLDVAAHIKHLDPNHLVTTGMKSTHHAWLHTPALQEALYSSPNIDFVTIHSYEGMTDHDGDRRVYDDGPLAIRLNKPFIVEEAGFDIRLFPDRLPKYRDHADRWYAMGASGYMPWGFIHAHEIGDGDNMVGFGSNLGDFQQLGSYFQSLSARLHGSMNGHAPSHAPSHAMALPVHHAPSLVGFDFQDLNQKYVANGNGPAINDASDYGVRVVEANVSPGQSYWKAIGVYHLAPQENTGKHHVFAEILDESGRRIRDGALSLAWGWVGQQSGQASPNVHFDKGDNEPATNVPIHNGQRMWVRVAGHFTSDTVEEMHTKHADEGTGNTIGHHSYYVVFQRHRKAAAPGLNGEGTSEVDVAPVAPVAPIAPVAPVVGGRVRAAEKIGIDANAPINPASGTISDQVRDPRIIADSGAGWVRINFILGQQWRDPLDMARPQGLTWAQTYDQIISGYRQRGMRIYGLIGSEAVHEQIGDNFRDAPSGNPLQHGWIQHYARNFVTIARLFRDDIDVLESFNEPDDWNGQTRNWIHPGWFAAMLQAIHDAMRAEPDLQHIRLVSGPLQGLQGENKGNGARDYLTKTYQAGVDRFGWGQGGRPFPFDGIGYHLYVHERFTSDAGAQASSIRSTYNTYINEIRKVVRDHEGREKPLYISEMGWFANGGNREQMEAFQAESLRVALNSLVADPAVALVINFCTQDFGSPTEGKFYGLYRAGALSPDNRKPVFAAFQEVCQQTLDLPNVATGQPVRADNAQYVAGRDAIADFTVVPPGERLTQVWFVKNTGATTWGPGYRVVWVGKSSLGAPPSAPIPTCRPGQEVPITVSFVAPQEPNTYQTVWQLCGPDDQLFGEPFWMYITVPHEQPSPAINAGVAPIMGQGIVAPAGSTANMIAVAHAWNRYGTLILEHCNRLGIDPGVGLAITLVESGGEPFGPDGRMVIRFENHIFFNLWGKNNQAQFSQHFLADATGHWWRPNAGSPWQSFHGNQALEWQVFETARGLDETAAMHSISMGAGQVMGFNFADLNYPNVQAMFQDFKSSLQSQLAGMFRFIEANGLVDEVRNRNLGALASRYNGAKEPHASRMLAYVEAYDALRAAVGPAMAPAVVQLAPQIATQIAPVGAPASPAGAAMAPQAAPSLENSAALPMPSIKKEIQAADPELYKAWRTHIEQGFNNNQMMFNQLLEGFMNPYWTTVWFYRILFGLGVLSFLVAAAVALRAGSAASVATLGGISLVSLLTFFFNRPLQALEENLQFITWLGVLYNSYWARLASANDPKTIQSDLQEITDDTVVKIQELMDKHAKSSGTRPGLR